MKGSPKYALVSMLALAVASGCSVAPERVRPNDVRLEAAFRNPFYANLCFVIESNGTDSPRYFRVRLPMPDGEMYISGTRGQAPTLRVLNKDITHGSCITEGVPMAITEVPFDGTKTVPEGRTESLYVAYEGGALAAMGYVSTKPIFDHFYSYAVDIDGLLAATPKTNSQKAMESAAETMPRLAKQVGVTVLFSLVMVYCITDIDCLISAVNQER